LRIVILPAGGIILAGVQAILVTLLRGNLVHVVVAAVPTIAIVSTILPVIGILIVWPALGAGS
jgi:galactitol-specific phosphotransferase system IIC component